MFLIQKIKLREFRKRDIVLNSRWWTIYHLTYFQTSDGKKYKSSVIKTADILRLIQSLPSQKADSFKIWLAQVCSEKLDEIGRFIESINILTKWNE